MSKTTENSTQADWADFSNFNLISRAISMPSRSKSDLEKLDLGGQEFLHEYAHHLQAVSTGFGAACLRGNIGRASALAEALGVQPEMDRPLDKWEDSAASTREELQSDAQQFYSMLGRLRGVEAIRTPSLKAPEFSIVSAVFPIVHPGMNKEVLCVSRKLSDVNLVVPILARALCEANAEAMSMLLSGSPSSLFRHTSRESEEDLLFYTTLYGLLAKELKEAEVGALPGYLAALTDSSLIQFSMDKVFAAGMEIARDFSKNGATPEMLRRELFSKLSEREALEARITEMEPLLQALERDNPAAQMLKRQLDYVKAALELRLREPDFFIPRHAETAPAFRERLLGRFPVVLVRTCDGIVGVGDFDDEFLESQERLDALAHLVQYVFGEQPQPNCPKRHYCGFDRTPDCQMSPWRRGAVNGQRETCVHGDVGVSLGLVKPE